MLPVWDEGGPSGVERVVWLALAAACCAVLTSAITVLYLGGREIMGLGGFVASGGPYEIAHPAPDWVWVIPVACVGGMMAGWVHALAAWRLNGFHLAFIGWTLLFGSLGVAFLEAGLDPPGGGTSWAWLVTGVVFEAMALPALAIMVARMLPAARDLPDVVRGRTGSALYIAVNVLALVAGIPVGGAFFLAVSGG